MDRILLVLLLFHLFKSLNTFSLMPTLLDCLIRSSSNTLISSPPPSKQTKSAENKNQITSATTTTTIYQTVFQTMDHIKKITNRIKKEMKKREKREKRKGLKKKEEEEERIRLSIKSVVYFTDHSCNFFPSPFACSSDSNKR